MGGIEELLYSLALAVLRTVRRWTQKELAAASGERSETISSWENARPAPNRATLVRLVLVMGFRASIVDDTLTFLEMALPAFSGRPGGSGGGPGLEERIDAVARRLASEHETALRRNLRAGVREGMSILEREIAEELWLALRDLEPKARRLVVETDARYHRWGLAELLAHESEYAAADEAQMALDLAELAVLVAEKHEGEERWSFRILGYALFFLANALRVAGNFLEADRKVSRAWTLWWNGAASDPGILDEGRLFDLEASLRRDQRRLPESLACLEEALRRSEAAGLPRLLVKKAKTLEEMGEAEDAIRTLLEALPRVDPTEEPRLAWSIRFNLVVNLCNLGRAEEGEAWLPELGELAMELGNGLDRVRFRWLQGKIHTGGGRHEDALAALAEARDGFLSRGIAYDAALVSLEMAVILLGEGQLSEVKEVARHLAPIFSGQGVHREALAALLVFRDAAEAEAATLEETRRILHFLRRAQNDPALRWPGAKAEGGGAS
jgi:tetratricopeptide (TPR) repeat protein/DNA-binding XRE family transcriptional regulator